MITRMEEGKVYVTRAGEVLGPYHQIGDDLWETPAGAATARFGDGRLNKTHECDRDLVAEWTSVGPNGDVKAEIADEAKRIVSGARRSAYGSPEQNFERIARFWQAYFENTGRGNLKITAADVSPMMRLMKEARLCETPDHRDSFVDLVGYALTGAEVNGVTPLDKPVG